VSRKTGGAFGCTDRATALLGAFGAGRVGSGRVGSDRASPPSRAPPQARQGRQSSVILTSSSSSSIFTSSSWPARALPLRLDFFTGAALPFRDVGPIVRVG